MMGKSKSGRGEVCRSGCTRSRAAELFLPKKTCPQRGSARLPYHATLEAPIATVRTHNGWLTAHRPLQSRLRHRPASADPHDMRSGHGGAAVAHGTDVRALARDAGVW